MRKRTFSIGNVSRINFPRPVSHGPVQPPDPSIFALSAQLPSHYQIAPITRRSSSKENRNINEVQSKFSESILYERDWFPVDDPES